jgi:small GTP-binding protein
MSKEENKIVDLKIVFLGDQNIGKTSFFNRYLKGEFIINTESTIGATFFKKEIEYNNSKDILTIGIWDISGSPLYNNLINFYCKGAELCILFFGNINYIKINRYN